MIPAPKRIKELLAAMKMQVADSLDRKRTAAQKPASTRIDIDSLLEVGNAITGPPSQTCSQEIDMIITDGELRALIQREKNPLLTDYEPPADWNDKDSLVQPCSIDLHIGAIFQPGVRAGQAGSAENPKSELVLKTGQTAVVATRESIHLSGGYAGYGFPPAHISSKALLMTNPGHIDPGYSGKLQFTVINMGREDYVLRSTDLIVTLLIFKLDTQVIADYSARRAKPASTITQSDIDRLSRDFVDVQRRAKSIAKRTLGISTVGASVLAIVLSWLVNAVEKRFSGMDELKVKLAEVDAANANLANELQATKEELQKQIDIGNRLTKLELEKKTTGGPK